MTALGMRALHCVWRTKQKTKNKKQKQLILNHALTHAYISHTCSLQAGTDGHDSAEDARAALRLAQLKMRNGPSYGVAAADTVALLAVLHKYDVAATVVGPSGFVACR
jgi:hypothetical protein